MIEYTTLSRLKQSLETEYMARHRDHKRLREYWQGTGYWKAEESERSLASLFKDLRGDQGLEPDIKLVNNILQQVCVKYQSFLSSLPMIRVPVEAPITRLRKEQASRKERYLYGTWNQRPYSMKQVLGDASWYLPLMGDCFLGAFPDLEDKLVRPLLRSPEYAFPVPSYDGVNLDAVIFSWQVPESRIKRQFPNYTLRSERKSRSTFFGIPLRIRTPTADPLVEVLEYSDTREFCRYIDGERVNGVDHNFGFNLFDQLSFIHVPDEPWNHGAVEQAVNMVEAGNAMQSLLLQATMENVFPMLALINPMKAPEEIIRGPGSVLPINEGGDAKFLAPPMNTLGMTSQLLQENERSVKQATSMPDANFGHVNASIITGKAINELQGAGTGSLVEMVQGIGIGTGLVSWNEKAIVLAQRMLREDQINLQGYETGSTFELTPKFFKDTVKGKELVGGARNEVVFSPNLDKHEKLVMMLQALGAELVSRGYAREQIGISDSALMSEDILGEKIEAAVVEAILMELQQAATPEAAEDVERRAVAYLGGASGSSGAPIVQPLPAGSAPPGGPLGPPPVSSGALPPGPLPAAALPAGPELAQEAPQTGVVRLDEAVAAFQQVQVEGRVFLVGEILSGRTDDAIEVSLTEAGDRAVLAESLSQYDLVFHVVKGEPREQFIEVTPGAVPEPQGEEPDLDALLAGAPQ